MTVINVADLQNFNSDPDFTLNFYSYPCTNFIKFDWQVIGHTQTLNITGTSCV